MKKRLTLALFAILLLVLSCSKIDDGRMGFATDSELKEYNISIKGLDRSNVHTYEYEDYKYFNGYISNKLWVGVYNKADKSKEVEWMEGKELDKTISYNEGFGEMVTFNVKWGEITDVVHNEEKLAFKLKGRGAKEYEIVEDLYLIENKDNTPIRKTRSRNYTSRVISFWYEGFAISNSRWVTIIDGKGKQLYMFDAMRLGQISLYQYQYEYYEHYPQSYEEAIIVPNFIIPYGILYILRYNFKDGTITWGMPGIQLGDSNERIRIDNYNGVINNNALTCKLDYTTYKGKKGSISVKINIETGEHEIL